MNPDDPYYPIAEAFQSLENARQDDFKPQSVLAWIDDLKNNLKWSPTKCLIAIEQLKYKEIKWRLQLSDIVSDDKPVFNWRTINYLVDDALKKKGVVSLKEYNQAVADYNTLLDSTKDKTRVVGEYAEDEVAAKGRFIDETALEIKAIYDKAIITAIYNLGTNKDKALSVATTIMTTAKQEVEFYIDKLKKEK